MTEYLIPQVTRCADDFMSLYVSPKSRNTYKVHKISPKYSFCWWYWYLTINSWLKIEFKLNHAKRYQSVSEASDTLHKSLSKRCKKLYYLLGNMQLMWPVTSKVVMRCIRSPTSDHCHTVEFTLILVSKNHQKQKSFCWSHPQSTLSFLVFFVGILVGHSIA